MWEISEDTARVRLLKSVQNGTELATVCRDSLQTPSGTWLSICEYKSLCQRATEAFGCQAALNLTEGYHARMAGMPGYLATCQATVRDMLLCLERYSGLLMRGAKIKLIEAGNIARLLYYSRGDTIPFDEEFMVLALSAALRHYVGEEAIKHVMVLGLSGGTDTLTNRIRTRVAKAAVISELVLDAHALGHPVDTADADLSIAFERLLGASTLESPACRISVRLRQIIDSAIASGHP